MVLVYILRIPPAMVFGEVSEAVLDESLRYLGGVWGCFGEVSGGVLEGLLWHFERILGGRNKEQITYSSYYLISLFWLICLISLCGY